jgi:transcriptional regulator GlxA family with amidase domain
MAYTYGLFVYENAASLDFIGPSDVFGISGYLMKKGRVITVAQTPGSIHCFGGLEIVPQETIDTSPPLDVLVVPGTGDPDAIHAIGDQALNWIRAQADQAKFITAVCTGALILQKTGLLRQRKATTHWMHLETLSQDPTITVLPEMRYVRDGNLVTSQGVSAGIDMALWLVGQLHSPDHARQVRKILQYDPAPPYTAEV